MGRLRPFVLIAMVAAPLASNAVADDRPAPTRSELGWILGHGAPLRTSLGIDSPQVFAWQTLDTDADYALVTVVHRRVLTGDLTAGRLLFAFLAAIAAVLGLTTARFLAAVHPSVAVISVGANNDYHHPAPSTLARLERAGVRILRTDLEGTITMESDGSKIWTRSARFGGEDHREVSAR